jgi:tetratricopeptide (TPR) repeat protein
MRSAHLAFILLCLITPLIGQEKLPEGPTSEKAQKTYNEAMLYVHRNILDVALDDFKKADKQDGGKCLACQKQVIKYGLKLHEWKSAETAAEEMLAEVEGQKDKRDIALAHYQLGMILLEEGMNRHKDEVFQHAHDEMGKALAIAPNFPAAVFADGRILAYLKQDEAAKAQFTHYVEMKKDDSPERQRAMLYITQPELARQPMAPPFEVTTLR